jgi:hypothetical protein
MAISSYFGMMDFRDFIRSLEPQIENLTCPGEVMCAVDKELMG